MLDPKAYYRTLDGYLASIDADARGLPDSEQLERVFLDFYRGFAGPLGLSGGALYRREGSDFERSTAWGEDPESWPPRLSGNELLVQQLAGAGLGFLHLDELSREHTPRDAPAALCVGIAVGQQPDYLAVWLLSPRWDQQNLDLYLHTLRNELDHRLARAQHKRQMAEAREVQLSLLPPTTPSFPGWELAAHTLPAETVGGDFYDFIPVEEHVLGVAIGDASGHGLAAALQARDVVTGLRMGIEADFKISRTIAKLNRVVARSSLSSRFVSLVYCELDRQGSVFYVNAGHPAPIKLSPNGVLTRLNVRNLVLGPKPDARYERGYVHLERDELLVLLSDGVLERSSSEGQEFGERQLAHLLRSRHWKSAQELVEKLWDAAVEHGERAPWTDDATVVVIRRTADPYWDGP